MSGAPSEQNTKTHWESIFRQYNVIWQYPGTGPHASYSLWNKHADFYFNSDCLNNNTSLLDLTAKALIEAISPGLIVKPDWIITYPPFGLEIGSRVADLLQCNFGYIKSLEHSELEFDVQRGENVLFCADDLHTGKSFRVVANALQKIGAKLLQPLAVICNFSEGSKFDGNEVVSLFSKRINIWDADDCPLCKSGSMAVAARKNWSLFAP